MLNFASLFNQFRSQSNNGLGDLLEQSNVKMGRLLDEEPFLNEYKTASNSKVIEFMKYDRYDELVEFITVIGPADDKKRGYKYPLAACDLLCVDNQAALDYFFPDEPLTASEKVIEEVEEEIQEKIEAEQLTVQKEQGELVPSEQENTEHVTQESEAKKQEAVEGEKSAPNQQVAKKQTEQTIKQPQYRKVKVKRQQEKIVKRELVPLIDKLMAYFSGEINYTLTAYVCRVLTFLSNKKPANFLRYFLQEKFTTAILNHAESRSVGELITKVLVNQSQICIEQRKAFFKAMLDRISLNSEVYIMSNISSYICEVIEKAAANLKSATKIIQFGDLFFSIQVVTQVIKNVMSDQENVSVYNSPILFAFLTSVPFVLPEDPSVKSDFAALVEHFVEKSCEKLNVKAQHHPKIGLGRIKILEILRYVLKEDILSSRDIIAKNSAFFQILVNLFKEYPMSSMLHNEIVKIIDIALTDSEKTPLNSAILRGNVLISFIKEEVEEDQRIRKGDSVYKSRKGFIAHLINIASKMKEVAQNNTAVKAVIESPQYSPIYESFFDKEIFNSKKSLAGFMVKKDAKHHQVKFQKEDIIAAYASFLRKCPPPVFEQPEPIADSHPDLVEELQKQIEESLTIKHKEGDKHVEPQKPVEIAQGKAVEGEIQEEPKIWEAVLCYDLEDLPYDL